MQMFVIYAYKIHVCVTFEKLKKKMFNILRQSGFFLHFFIVLCFKTKTFFPYFKTKTVDLAPWFLSPSSFPSVDLSFANVLTRGQPHVVGDSSGVLCFRTRFLPPSFSCLWTTR